jgi:DNA-binding HxlR family transcriptional regulator
MKDTDSTASALDPAQSWRAVRAALGEEYLAGASTERLGGFEKLILAASVDGNEPNGPVREVQALVGDRWCGLLLPLLHFGPLRFSTLQRIVDLTDQEGISRRMLSFKLRALERDGFVQRIEQTGLPKRVEYSLTQMGEEFYPVYMQLITWLTGHSDKINAARQSFTRDDEAAEGATG